MVCENTGGLFQYSKLFQLYFLNNLVLFLTFSIDGYLFVRNHIVVRELVWPMKNYICFCIIIAILFFFAPHPAYTQWVQTSLTNTTVQAFAVSGTNFFAATYSGVYLSTDNGTNWSAMNAGLTNLYIHSLAVSGTNLFAGTRDSGVFLSTNNGISWTPVNSGLTNNTIYALAVSGTNLYAGTRDSGVFLSTNNGTNWTAAGTGTKNMKVYSLAVNGAYLFAGTEYGDVYRTSNNGTSWTAVRIGLANGSVSTIVVSGANLYAGTDGGGVFLSTNNGTSWTPTIDNYLTDKRIQAIAVSGTNLFVGTFHDGVFLLTNNAIRWYNVSIGLVNLFVRSFAIIGSNIFAGTGGAGVWRRPLSEMITSGAVSPNEQLASFMLDQNYPNPFTTSTTISFTLAERGFVALDIYDILGRKVGALVNEIMDAGHHSIEFDAKNVSDGAYTAKMRMNGGEREMKMVRITN